MNEEILKQAREFLVSYLKDRTIDYEVKHPWRKNWEFVALHSYRVEGYVKRILEDESHNMTADEIMLTRLAALLHDIGRIHRREGHALIGSQIVQQWLKSNEGIADSIYDCPRLLFLIERHSNKEGCEEDFCLKVLRDADVLDEIGIMSIFMSANWIDKANPYFFNMLLERVEGFELEFCENGFKLLKTDAAKAILQEKLEFIKVFSRQLRDELMDSLNFDKIDLQGNMKISNEIEVF